MPDTETTYSHAQIEERLFDLARKCDDVALWRPATGAALKGTPNTFVRGGSRRP